MDLKWFQDALKEEVEGSITYIKIAIELKAMSDKMSKNFFDMSVQEADHAKKLFEMSMEYYTKVSEAWDDSLPKFMEDIKNDIVKCYTEKAVEIKMLQSMYKD